MVRGATVSPHSFSYVYVPPNERDVAAASGALVQLILQDSQAALEYGLKLAHWLSNRQRSDESNRVLQAYYQAYSRSNAEPEAMKTPPSILEGHATADEVIAAAKNDVRAGAYDRARNLFALSFQMLERDIGAVESPSLLLYGAKATVIEQMRGVLSFYYAEARQVLAQGNAEKSAAPP